MKYRFIIFDLDGTLLYTLDDIRDSLNHTLRRFGLPEKAMDEVRGSLGNGSARLVELCVPGGRKNPDFEAVFAEYSAWYAGHALCKTRPYPGILELLEQLFSSGAKTAIVSNKPDASVKYLDAHFFSGLTAAAIGEKPGTRRKPAPDSVFEAMAALGAAREDTVYVGDSEVDIATAQKAGIDCISVAWGFRSTTELEAAGADSIVAD
ncbi:MAG: HAD family hydrolase, partial [Clostridia bacterium]|nr:HAD family hydrolase [Clostridia bacterium]